MKKNISFIINPISGTQNKQNVIENIPIIINKDKFNWDIAITEYPGHASILTNYYVNQGYDAVIAVGGDGTINEIARSLIHSRTSLGIIPLGSGNGLARHLNIPLEPLKALNIINSFTTKYIDYGLINEIPFFCTCGIGFDAFVSSKFAKSGRRGALSYIENTLKEGLKYKPETYEIEIDNEYSIKKKKYKAFLIACANASQYGNNAYIAPHASMDDGLMDVVIMEPFSMIEAPQIAIQLFNKTIYNNSRIKTFKCKKIHITRKKTGIVHFDGDPIILGKDIDVKIINRSLSIITPPAPIIEHTLLNKVYEFYEVITNYKENLKKENKIQLKHLNLSMIRKIRKKLK